MMNKGFVPAGTPKCQFDVSTPELFPLSQLCYREVSSVKFAINILLDLLVISEFHVFNLCWNDLFRVRDNYPDPKAPLLR